MFICSEPLILPASSGSGFQFFSIFCVDPNTGISYPDPDSPVWIPWEDCNVTGFCENFSEEDFTMQIEQNSGSNFIRFPGTNEGRSVIVESGTYQISEEGDITVGTCPNPIYSGTVAIVNPPPPQQPTSYAAFCSILEGDCSGTIEAGEEKACTIKNYLITGAFGVPIGGLTASNTNTETSAFNINTAGGLTPSLSPPPITQETEDSPGLTALEKTTKLKQQWLELLP